MTVVARLSTSLGRLDEVPNQKLAEEIARRKDKRAIVELFENLANKNKGIQQDCIKVIYEIGEQNALLIAPFVKELLGLLNSSNNRLQWGAMTALATITSERPKEIASALKKIVKVANMGSVISRDNAFTILIRLYAFKAYRSNVFPLILDQLETSPVNQLPMYAERAFPFIVDNHCKPFAETLRERLDDIEKESKRRRVERVIKKISG